MFLVFVGVVVFGRQLLFSLLSSFPCRHVLQCGLSVVKFSRGCLIFFEDKLDWDNQFIFAGFYTKDEDLVINEVLDSHFVCM